MQCTIILTERAQRWILSLLPKDHGVLLSLKSLGNAEEYEYCQSMYPLGLEHKHVACLASGIPFLVPYQDVPLIHGLVIDYGGMDPDNPNFIYLNPHDRGESGERAFLKAKVIAVRV